MLQKSERIYAMSQKRTEKLSERQIKKHLQNRLGELMNQKDMNQIILAVETGVSRQNLAKYLSGKAIPNSYTLYKLAFALDTTCDYLLGHEEGTNHNINYSIEQTGLSEKAIKKLTEYVNEKNSQKENLLFAINRLLENEYAADFLLSFARYTAVPDINKYEFTDDCFSRLYGKYTFLATENSKYGLEDSMEFIKIEEIIYYQLMQNFQILLEKTKNNPKTREEYIRMFEQRVQTEHDYEIARATEDIIDIFSGN